MKRNRYYNNIAKKHKLVRTIVPMYDEELALKYEDWLMEYYHTWVDDPQATEHACNIDGPGTNGGSKTASKETRLKQRQSHLGITTHNKGKTNVERYGEERAKEIKLKASKSRKCHIPWNKGKKICQAYKKRKPISEETREKMRQSTKNKPVEKLDLITGEIIARFDCARQASRQTGINHSNICSYCHGVYGHSHAGGFKWRFVICQERN